MQAKHVKGTISICAALIAGVALIAASGAGAAKAPSTARIDVSTKAAVVHYLRSIHVNPKGVVIQRGAHNYAGPNCPGKRWACAAARHTVVQIAKRGGQNRFVCKSSKCVVVQISGASHGFYASGGRLASTAAPNKGGNSGVCVKTGSGATTGSGQTCSITQSGSGLNTAGVYENTQKVSGLTQNAQYNATITQTSSGAGNTACVTQIINLDGSTTNTNGKPTTANLQAHQSVTIKQDAAGNGTNSAQSAAASTGACITNPGPNDLANLTQSQTLTSTVTATGPITQNEDTAYNPCGDGVAGDYANLCLDIEQNQSTGFKCTSSTSCPTSGTNTAIFTQNSTQAAVANATKGAEVNQTQSTPLCSDPNAPAGCVFPGGLVGTVNQDSGGQSTATPTQNETQCEDAAPSGLSATNCLPTPTPPDSPIIPGGLHQKQYGPVGVGKVRHNHRGRQPFNHGKGLGQARQTGGNGSDTYTITQTSTQNADIGAEQQNLGQADCSTDGHCTAAQTTTVNGTMTQDGYTAPSIPNLTITCAGGNTACAPTPPPVPTLVTKPTNPNFSSGGVFTWTDAATGGITFKCKVDGGVFTSTNCASGNSFTNTYGDHSFQVEAVDNFGNASAPTTEYDWTNVPPTPSIDSGPGPTTSPDASFTFSDSDTSLSFVCSLDASAYSACASGQTYNALDPGLHTFSVEATDGNNHFSAAASTQWTISSDNPNVLIAGAGDAAYVADNSPSATEANDNLAAALTAAGYTVTELATLPADLSSFGQVWWVDSNPPTAGEQDQLVAFAESGGGVFLTGEWEGFGADLNAADQSMVNSIVSGGGITLGGQGCCAGTPIAYSVNSGVVGNLATAPHTITTWTPTFPGLISGMAASSVFASDAPTEVAAAAWNRSSNVGEGRLVVFMDINWAQAAWEGANFSDVAENVAFFLSGLSSPPAPPVGPALKFSLMGPRSLAAPAPTSAAPRTAASGR